MPILTIDHAAAVRRLAALSAYRGQLDAAKRTAVELRLDPHAAGLDAMIRDAQIACHDAQETIDRYERQEAERARTRDSRTTARILEQLMLRPAGAVL